MAEKTVTLTTELDPKVPLPHPEAANFFQVTFVGAEIQLLVGWLNITEMSQKMRGGETQQDQPISLTPNVTHHLMLSRFGFDMLRTRLNEVARQIDTAEKSK